MEKVTFSLNSKTEKKITDLKKKFYRESTENSMFADLISRGLQESQKESGIKDGDRAKDGSAKHNHTGCVLDNRRI